MCGNTFLFEPNNLFTPSVCFLALVPLEKLFDFGGEQLSMYCGEDLGDLIVVTLNKYARVSRVCSSALTLDPQYRGGYPRNHPSF
jgi:hypothetical protein